MKKVLLIVGAVLAVAAIAVGGYTYAALHSVYKGFAEDPLLVQVNLGSGTRDIARQLTEAGVLEQEWPFLLARGWRRDAVLQAGEYSFSEAASPWEVFDRLARGDIYYFDVTIPEGSNIWEIARLLELEGLYSESDFLTAASDPALILDLAPEADSLEGYLFPSTYRISHSTTVQELVQMMVEEFRRQWQRLNPDSADSARSMHETLTLASLVEKETGVASERELVAGVFANRLEREIPLACDPTVIYAALLVDKWRGTIYRSDLDRDHPYNTYLHAGLPPGPIANPGAAAIAAALDPAKTDYLFFVAKPTGGGHVFTSNNADHNRAVQAYRQGLASQ